MKNVLLGLYSIHLALGKIFKITTMTFKRFKEISSTLLQNPIFNDLSEEELSEYLYLLTVPKYSHWELKKQD